MQFLWAPALWLLASVPLLIGLYVWMQRRRHQAALRYASLALIKPALDPRARWRRYIPPALFFIALTAMFIALARPYAQVRTPKQEGIIILALDASLSMRAPDIQPNRFEAARQAARAFIEKRSGGAEIGIVAFGGSAAIVQMPTAKTGDLNAALNTLFLQRGTAIGEGIITSLDAIALAGREAPPPNINSALDEEQELLLPPVAPGTFIPAIVVLLTDGQNRNGRDPLEAAKLAAERGVRVYTVGIGSREGALIPGGLGGATFGGNGFRAELDEETLRAIAAETTGEYFYAASAGELEKIYSDLGLNLVLKLEQAELTAYVTAFAALLLFAAIGLSLWWNSLT